MAEEASTLDGKTEELLFCVGVTLSELKQQGKDVGQTVYVETVFRPLVLYSRYRKNEHDLEEGGHANQEARQSSVMCARRRACLTPDMTCQLLKWLM